MGAWRAVEMITQGERVGEHPPKRTVPPPVMRHAHGDWGGCRGRIDEITLTPSDGAQGVVAGKQKVQIPGPQMEKATGL